MSKNVKYCESCGEKNEAKAKFCDGCGKAFGKGKKAAEDKTQSTEKGSGLEIISLVTSILGFTCLPGIGFIIAIVTGIMSPNPKENKYTRAGITIGSFGLIIPGFILGILGIIFGAMEGTDDLVWMIILGIIALIGSGIGLFFFIKWMKKPAE
ncbi:MAG: hypothetical protein ACTSPM_00430 [Candidatus Heimdallarchaeota archaeon]